MFSASTVEKAKDTQRGIALEDLTDSRPSGLNSGSRPWEVDQCPIHQRTESTRLAAGFRTADESAIYTEAANLKFNLAL